MSKITESFVESAMRHGVAVKANSSKSAAPENITYASVIEMANLGFKIDVADLKGMSTKALTQMIEQARKIVGSDRNMVPVYPGFPKQVQELSTVTLIVEQLMHYWSGGALLPDYPDVARNGVALADIARSARDLKVMSAKEAAQHFVETLTTNSISMSEDDKNLLKGSVDLLSLKVSDVSAIIAQAKNEENIQSLILAVKDNFKNSHSVNELVQEWVNVVRSADGVLRVVLALVTEPVSGKDDSYEKTVRHLNDSTANSLKMVSLSKPARRAILVKLEKVSKGFNVDKVVAHRNIWRRVMRMVHPYSFSVVKNDGVRRTVDIIHENVEYKTYNSLIEEALAEKNVEKVVELLGSHQPGNLLRRVVSILRMCENKSDAQILSDGIEKNCGNSKLTTLISSYNGVLSTNDSHARLTRVAGAHNTLVEKEVQEVNALYVSMVLSALAATIKHNLAKTEAPVGAVNVMGSENVPLVRRDLAITDREMDRGETLSLVGEGDTVRLFNHWRNNQGSAGYMDTGAVVLDKDFNTLNVITWDSWHGGRAWATYSGDKNVMPGDEAAEYIDVDMKKLKKDLPEAKWIAMTIQSWSGFITKNVDVIAGVMVRSEPNSGEVFDPRTLTTAFKPTTESLQSVPLVVNIETGQMVWIDSSSGSTRSGMSASHDETVGPVVYDEIARPRLTMGELAELWAEVHGAEINKGEKVDKKQILSLL